jgi:hypothetical protein
MSWQCAKCESDDATKTNLVKKYQGSSKGMEENGAAVNVNWVYEYFKCYIKTYLVIDEVSRWQKRFIELIGLQQLKQTKRNRTTACYMFLTSLFFSVQMETTRQRLMLALLCTRPRS